MIHVKIHSYHVLTKKNRLGMIFHLKIYSNVNDNIGIIHGKIHSIDDLFTYLRKEFFDHVCWWYRDPC